MEPRICWFVALAVATLHTLQTAYYQMTPTVLMPSIIKDFGATVVSASAVVAVSRLAYIAALPCGGWLVDRWGPQRCILAAVSALGASAVCFSLMKSMKQFAVLQAINALAMAFAGVPVYSVLLCQFFREHLGTALGMVLSGFSLAGALSSIILGAVASHASWRAAALVVAGAIVCAAIPLSVWLQRVRPPGVLAPQSAQNVSVEDGGGPVKGHTDDRVSMKAQATELAHELLPNGSMPVASFEPVDDQKVDQERRGMNEINEQSTSMVLWKSPAFVYLALSYFLLQYSYGSYNEHFLIYMTMDKEANLHFATIFLAALYFSTFMAKIIGGYVGDRWSRVAATTVAAFISILGAGLLMTFVLRLSGFRGSSERAVTGPFQVFCLVGFSVFFGAGYGAMFNANYTLVPQIIGTTRLGLIQSILFAIGLCGNGAGALFTGYLRSWTRHYLQPFLVAFSAVVLNALSMFALMRHYKRSRHTQIRPSLSVRP
jgi:MFS family permease